MAVQELPDSAFVRHPLRGALWGIPLGLGVAAILIGRKVIAMGTITPLLVIVLAVVVGAALGSFGPARSGRGEPADTVRPPVEVQPPADAWPGPPTGETTDPESPGR